MSHLNRMNGQLVDDPDLQDDLEPVDYCDLLEEHPELYQPVIDGLLRVGETCNVIAAPKVGKSFLSVGLAWCIADGRPWLGFDVEPGRVLIVDNELHEPTLSHRIDNVAYAMMIPPSDRRGKIDVISLRGKLCDIHGLHSRLSKIEPGTYRMVILDALYRTLPAGSSENDNAAMMAIYNRLDQYAAKMNSAFVVIHHSSKGSQGDKGITDVGAGAGSIARAADTHIVIREHESEGHHVLEAVTRSFKSPDPVTITFDWPLWNATAMTPEVKTATRMRSDEQKKADDAAMDQMHESIPDGKKGIRQDKLFEDAAIGGWAKSKRIADMLVRSGRAERRRKPTNGRETVFYRRKANPNPESNPESS